MKILYGIQGTGHGHISRAKELLPELRKHANVEVLISGFASQLELENAVQYRKHGMSLAYDSKGGVSILDTLIGIKPVRFINDVKAVPLEEYDLVVSDYEPVTAWAARFGNVPSVGLSHQAAFLSDLAPRPVSRSALAEAILKHFAPTDRAIGFHFQRYDTFIEPPIIRSDIRRLNPTKSNHITVYLPAYHHQELASILGSIDEVDWHIFSPSCLRYEERGHIKIHPVSNTDFLESFESCTGVVTSAGFETSAEAMYLGKKLLVVPIKNQYEQLCNAAALSRMGIKVFEDLNDRSDEIREWLEQAPIVGMQDVADPERIIAKLLSTGPDKNLPHEESKRVKEPKGII